MIELSEAYPQIAIAIAIIAAAMLLTKFLLRNKKQPASTADVLEQVSKLVKVMTNDNGDPVMCPLDECSTEFSGIKDTLDSHGEMHRKQFRAISELRKGQNEILDHVTNGTRPASLVPISADIDDEPTGNSI